MESTGCEEKQSREQASDLTPDIPHHRDTELTQGKHHENNFANNSDDNEKRESVNASKTTEVNGKTFKCDQCESSFRQKCNLKRHLKLHSGYKPHHCKECNASFYGQDALKRHVRTHTGEKPYTCDECSVSFSHSSHLKAHKRTHSGEKPFVCQECGASFSQSGNLKVHVRVHTGEKPYVCKICLAAFSNSSGFKKHKKVHTGERPFKCSYCGARFPNKVNLQRHHTTHTGEKPFKCLLCSAAFPVKNSLERHIKSHTGDRRYCCEMCGSVFLHMGDLTKHRKTHTGKKTIKCVECGMGFYSNAQQKIHMRTHTGEKPHKCMVCGMSFAQSGTLSKHRLTHTGEKPFKCDQCGVPFTAKSSLKKHIERHSYKAPQGINTTKSSEVHKVESQHIHSHTFNEVGGVCSQGLLPFLPRSSEVPLGNVQTNINNCTAEVSPSMNASFFNAEHPLTRDDKGQSSAISSISVHPTIMALDIENPASVPGGPPVQDTTYNSSVPIPDISAPVSEPLHNTDCYESSHTPPLAFTNLSKESELCGLEMETSHISASHTALPSGFHYFTSLPPWSRAKLTPSKQLNSQIASCTKVGSRFDEVAL